MKHLGIPFYLKNDQFSEPDLPNYFLLSADGLYLVKNLEMYRSCTKVEKGMPWLQDHSESVQLKFPKIPRRLVERVVAFFYLVYWIYKSEAFAFLYYSPTTRRFRVKIPPQKVRIPWNGFGKGCSYHVTYSGIPTPPGYVRIGTMHSHGPLPAYYSQTDLHDSRFDDSLNIVVGHLGDKRPSFSVNFMVSGSHFQLQPEDVMEPFQQPLFPIPRKWITQVEAI